MRQLHPLSVPVINREEYGKRQESEIVSHLHVTYFVLNKATYLTVNHAVMLRNQNEIKTQFSMLREEFNPVHARAAIRLPAPAVKNNLRFIHHNERLPLNAGRMI